MNMNTLQRFGIAPVTTKELKLNLFAPIDKVINQPAYAYETEVYDDNDYKVKIKGIKLTQIHRDILDLALFYGDQKLQQTTRENIPVRTFSLYEIQKHLNYKSKNQNAWLIKKFSELQQASIVLIDKKNKETYQFSIIRVSQHSEKQNAFVLVLEELYLALFEKNISVGYKELLPAILALKYPQSKAAIRYLLSFKSGHQINIMKLLNKIGVQGKKRYLNQVRNNVLKELDENKNIFNLELIKTDTDERKTGNITIKYTRSKSVQIYYPNAVKKKLGQ